MYKCRRVTGARCGGERWGAGRGAERRHRVRFPERGTEKTEKKKKIRKRRRSFEMKILPRRRRTAAIKTAYTRVDRCTTIYNNDYARGGFSVSLLGRNAAKTWKKKKNVRRAMTLRCIH